MAACRPCTRLLWTERYDPHAVGLSRSASHAEASKFQGKRTALHTSERAPLRCTSQLELAVEHWLKTLSTGSRNDANDPHGCRGDDSTTGLHVDDSAASSHGDYRQCNGAIDGGRMLTALDPLQYTGDQTPSPPYAALQACR